VVEHGALAQDSERRADEARAAELLRTGTEARARSEQARERSRLGQGAARAADLQQSERYRAGVALRVKELAARELVAKRRAHVAEKKTEAARAALVRARADEQTLERHVERLKRDAERAREAAEEEAGLEYVNALRSGARRG
jgi:hypothetical protein